MSSGKELIFTPIIDSSKLPILVLITGYCYGRFPAKSIPPILSTLVELIEGGRNTHFNTDDDDIVSEFFPPVLLILERLQRSIELFFKNQNSETEQTIKNYIFQVQSYLLGEIWGIQDIDEFYSFLKRSQASLVEQESLISDSDVKCFHNRQKMPKRLKKPLHSSSFLGKFVSSVSIATNTLMFNETVRLWEAFITYRAKSEEIWNNMKNANKNLTSNKAWGNMGQCNSKDEYIQQKVEQNTIVELGGTIVQEITSYSQVDLAQLLEFQVHKLQLYSGTIPNSLKRILLSMTESQRGTVPSSYYIKYLECWKSGDYEGSFRSLHRYFDYMMSNKQQLFYHYALLSLATLHSSFGSDEEALRAIDEAISVARENKDLNCLNYLLTWLFDFLKSRPELSYKFVDHPGREQILQFLKLKTKESKNPILQSMAYQHEAVKQMLEGFPLRKILNNLTRAFFILLNLDSSLNTKMSFCRSCQLTATVWARVGIQSVAELYIDTALQSAGKDISIFDEVELVLQRSLILYSKGDIDDAFEYLESYEDRVTGVAILMKSWQTRYMLLKADFWIRRYQFRQAGVLLDNLKSQISQIHDYELGCELEFECALFQSKLGNPTEATQIIFNQFSRLKESVNSFNNYWMINFQILYAEIIAKQSSSPERAISILLNSLNTAHKSSLLTLISKGSLALCDVLLRIDPVNSSHDVEEILSEGMPIILQTGDLQLSSKGYYLLSYTFFMAKEEHLSDDELPRIDVYLSKSLMGFKKLQDLEWIRKCLQLQKRIAIKNKDKKLQGDISISIDRVEAEIESGDQYGLC